MHSYFTPQPYKDRVLSRQGKAQSHDTIDATRTALVVVDMQNYFVAEGYPAEVPAARDIVPNINRMAKALRAAGGTVIWIQTTSAGALEQWGNHHKHMLTPDRVRKRLTELNEKHDGFQVFPKLEVMPGDLRIKKIKYSAFIPGSSNIDTELKARGIESLLIAGTATNVCCESTARDAMMLDYRVVMLSDGNAASTDEEHAGALNTFLMFFGDVMMVDEAVTRLTPVVKRETA